MPRRKKKKPINTKESPHDSYHVPKGTSVLLEESNQDIEFGTIKDHITTKHLEFTQEEFVEYLNGWYTFLREGWWFKVKRIHCSKTNINDLF